MSEKMLVVSTRCQSPDVFHTDEDCPRLVSAKNVRERAESYIEFHELSLCEYCDDSVDRA